MLICKVYLMSRPNIAIRDGLGESSITATVNLIEILSRTHRNRSSLQRSRVTGRCSLSSHLVIISLHRFGCPNLFGGQTRDARGRRIMRRLIIKSELNRFWHRKVPLERYWSCKVNRRRLSDSSVPNNQRFLLSKSWHLFSGRNLQVSWQNLSNWIRTRTSQFV